MRSPKFDQIRVKGVANHWCCPACYRYFSHKKVGATSCPNCEQKLFLKVEHDPVNIACVIENKGEE